MHIRDFRGKKTAVWGLGREGWAALSVLRAELPGLDVTVLNDSPLTSVEAERVGKLDRVSLCTGDAVKARLREFDVVIKSPGVSLYRPEIAQARDKGVIFTSSTNIWFAEHHGDRTVCITGTKGKSTTATLLTHLLNGSGIRSVLAGNVGMPLIQVLREKADVWVIELSSYQTADFTGSPWMSILLDLFPEHLDWHGGVEQYYKDKLHLFDQTANGWSVVNGADPGIEGIGFSFPRPVRFNTPEGLHVEKGWVKDGSRKVVSARNVPLAGAHNLSNLCAALTAIRLLGVPPDRAVQSLPTFAPLPHRLTVLGEKEGILFVDDSISTTPQSTIEAIRTYADRPITILLGGFDRGLDFTDLALFLLSAPVHAIVTLPDNGPRIAETIVKVFASAGRGLPVMVRADDLPDGVEKGRQVTPRGGVLLLSPASPSYGRFRNFEERGEVFQRSAGLQVEERRATVFPPLPHKEG